MLCLSISTNKSKGVAGHS